MDEVNKQFKESTVEELIEFLQGFDPKAVVCREDGEQLIPFRFATAGFTRTFDDLIEVKSSDEIREDAKGFYTEKGGRRRYITDHHTPVVVVD